MSNVVNIFEKREKKADSKADNETSFAEQMERNRKNKERIAKERAEKNKSVLRSYRIKS